jgi:hypothetical protein
MRGKASPANDFPNYAGGTWGGRCHAGPAGSSGSQLAGSRGIGRAPQMKTGDPRILTVNGGTSSTKFAMYEDGEVLKRVTYGTVDCIGLFGAKLTFPGRQARLIELDPKYCDTIIRRYRISLAQMHHSKPMAERLTRFEPRESRLQREIERCLREISEVAQLLRNAHPDLAGRGRRWPSRAVRPC